MNASFLKISALQLENRALKEKLKAFQSGEKYVRMKEEYEAIIRSKDRRIRALEKADPYRVPVALLFQPHLEQVYAMLIGCLTVVVVPVFEAVSTPGTTKP